MDIEQVLRTVGLLTLPLVAWMGLMGWPILLASCKIAPVRGEGCVWSSRQGLRFLLLMLGLWVGAVCSFLLALGIGVLIPGAAPGRA